jgi:hypothetical protein
LASEEDPLKDAMVLTIYLDTADFSKFGDVVRGRAEPSASSIFNRLLEFSESGVARFGYSMVTLSELFKYDPGTQK